MHDVAKRCPKCQGAMQNGFIVELCYGPPAGQRLDTG